MSIRPMIGMYIVLATAMPAARAADPKVPDYLATKDLTPVKVLAAPQHAPVVLVADGQAKAKVYVAENSGGTALGILLRELAETVKLASGADLERVGAMPGKDVPVIVIGDCEESRAAGIDAGALPVEGFVVKTAPNRVFLVGSTIRLTGKVGGPYSNEGTAWALADFLERFVGVRWYWPVNAGGRSVVPFKSLQVAPAHYSDQPVFQKRECYPPDSYPVSGALSGAIPAGVTKLDMSVMLAGLRNGNSWPYLIQVHMPQQIWKNQKLCQTHPELFKLTKEGKRDLSQLCYGHPNTLAFLLAGCDAVWGKNKDAMAPWCDHYVSWVTETCVTLSPFDYPVDCCCEYCSKLFDPNGGGGPNGKNRGSGSMIMGTFLKKFADEVKKRWPDKKVMYLPYWNYTVFPKGLDLPDNIEVQVCTMAFALMRQPSRQAEIEEYIGDWSRQVKGEVQTWEYHHRTIGYPGVYIQYPHVVKDYYQKNRDRLRGSFLNGGDIQDWTVAAPTHYVLMKALWNPDLDVDAAWEAMCRRQFGKAAGTALEFLNLAADRWEKTPWSIEQQGGMEDMGYLEPSIYRETWPDDVVAKMKALWLKAREELKDDPEALQRFLFVTWNMEGFLKDVKARSQPAAKSAGQ